MESPPAQTVRLCCGSLEQCPFLPGPRGPLPSFGWQGPTSPLIVWPHDVLEMHGFLHVVGDMSGHPDKKLYCWGMHTLGRLKGQSWKFFFARAKSLLASSWPGPSCTTQMVTCPGWPHSSPTLLQKQLRDIPIGMTHHHSPQWGLIPPCCLQEGKFPTHFPSPWWSGPSPHSGHFLTELQKKHQKSGDLHGECQQWLKLPSSPGGQFPWKKWRHQSTLLGRWWGDAAYLRAQYLRSLSWGGQEIWPPPGLWGWQMLLWPWGQFSLEKSGHWSTLLLRWWGHVAHLGTKDPRSLAQGDRRYSLASTTLVNLGEAAMSALGPRPLEKPIGPILTELLGKVGRGVGRCAIKMAGLCHPPPWSRAAQSKCAKSRQDRLPRDSY